MALTLRWRHETPDRLLGLRLSDRAVAHGASVTAQVVTLCTGRRVRLDPRLTGHDRDAAYYGLIARRREHFAKRKVLLEIAHKLECAALECVSKDAAWELRKQASAVTAEYEALCMKGYA